VFGLRNGSHAEYVCVPESRLIAPIPNGMTFEQAAAVCDGHSQAVKALRAGRVAERTNLLIYGATGSLGIGAVQLASLLGARVTAVCKGRDAELVRSLGADEVIDYELEDFTRNGKRYDVVFDAVGKHSYLRARRSLVPGGIFVATDRLFHLPLAYLTRWFGSTSVTFEFSGYRREDLLTLQKLLEAGRYRAVVDRVYPLERVAEASRYVDSWQKVGNVVLSFNGAER
jgi:NADPH:quinone reductase-like Zn-dependent oxidoreductase